MVWLRRATRRTNTAPYRVHISHYTDFTLQIEPWCSELLVRADEGVILELGSEMDRDIEVTYYQENFIGIWDLPGLTVIWTPDKLRSRPPGSRFVDASTGELLGEISDPNPEPR
jgi:hypothetical protein